MKLLALTTTILCLFGGGAQAANFLPLEAGNVWTYRNTETGETFTVRVGTPLWTGRVYYSLQGYSGRRDYARIDEQGRLVALDEETGEEKVLADFTPFAGGWWAASARAYSLEGQTQERRAAHAGPAGRWDEVLEIRYRTFECADAGPTLEQFVENIGMVRRVVSTIAGPRVLTWSTRESETRSSTAGIAERSPFL